MIIENIPTGEHSGTSGLGSAERFVDGTASVQACLDTSTATAMQRPLLVLQVSGVFPLLENANAEVRAGRPLCDEEFLRALYDEFSEEDRQLAEAGLLDYGERLRAIDRE